MSSPYPALPLDQPFAHDPNLTPATPQIQPWTEANTPVGDIIELNATNGWIPPKFGLFLRTPVEYSVSTVAGTEVLLRRIA